MPGRVYNLLHAHAVDQNGYVTTRDANELGVDPRRLYLMHERDLLLYVSRGVYRFGDVPAGPLVQRASGHITEAVAATAPVQQQVTLVHQIQPPRIDAELVGVARRDVAVLIDGMSVEEVVDAPRHRSNE